MAKRTTLNVSLTPKLAKFVRDQVKTGKYASSSEVVRRAISVMETRANATERLLKEIEQGLDDIRNGQTQDGEEFMRDWERRNAAAHRRTRKSA
jgi:putative addiction module CopG family antidote